MNDPLDFCRPGRAELSVVVDINVLVAAAFNAGSCSAQIINAIQAGRLRMVWNEQTRGESKRVLLKIPPISWTRFEELFRAESRLDLQLDLKPYEVVPDPEDRKFAALAGMSGSILVTQDAHLLGQAAHLPITVVSPVEFIAQLRHG